MEFHRTESEALRYISTLLSCSTGCAWDRPLTFQTFDDRKVNRSLARSMHGTFRELVPELVSLNRQGAGIFVTVNETDSAGRSSGHIVNLRGWHADLDRKRCGAGQDLSAIPIEASMLVWSGRGVHAYWVADCPMPCARDLGRKQAHKAELQSIQRRFAEFGADPAVCEVSRVLRLPGFYHVKNPADPQFVHVISTSGRTYSRDWILSEFPVPAPLAPSIQVPATKTSKSIRRAVGYLAAIEGAVQGRQGSTATLVTAIKLISRFGLGVEDTYALLLEYYNPRCQPPWDPCDLRRKVVEAAGIAEPRPLAARTVPARGISR